MRTWENTSLPLLMLPRRRYLCSTIATLHAPDLPLKTSLDRYGSDLHTLTCAHDGRRQPHPAGMLRRVDLPRFDTVLELS